MGKVFSGISYSFDLRVRHNNMLFGRCFGLLRLRLEGGKENTQPLEKYKCFSYVFKKGLGHEIEFKYMT